MSKFLKISAAVAGLGLVVGCAPLPTVAIPCGTCGPEAVYGIAVTKPSSCNDYPVTYRVQMPETDKRVRFVDRPELVSTTTQSSVVNSCGR
jgi:hypothetical protein